MNSVFLKLHLSVFIAGFTGLFGRLVSLNAVWISFFRMTVGGLCFYAYSKATHKIKNVPRHLCYSSMVAGALLSMHITLFYLAIKLSNVSIGTITISTISFFVAILEPLMSKSRFSMQDICYSLLGIIGLSFIFSFDARYRLGIAAGLLCAFFSALYSTYNRRIMANKDSDSYTMLNWQFLGASIMMCIVVSINRLITGEWGLYWSLSDAIYLFIAATVCTVGMYLLQLMVLKEISAFTLMLTYNLEPVYTILFACLIFHENRDFNFSFYIGLIFIIASVALKTYKVARIQKLDPGLKDA